MVLRRTPRFQEGTESSDFRKRSAGEGNNGWLGRRRVKAAVHWVRVNALSAESSPNLTLAAMGLRADSARWLSVRAEPLTR